MEMELSRPSLKQRILRAGVWSFAGFGLSQVIRFSSNLVTTRLLAPEMFGLMAIAFLLMNCLAMFSDIGLAINVIQSKRRDSLFLNTIWVTQIFRGFVLWGLALLVTMLIVVAEGKHIIPASSVYADPNFPYVVIIVSITAIIQGLQSTKLYEARRDLSFGPITRVEIASQIVGVFVMVSWALLDRSIWALAAGGICPVIITTVCSHIYLPGVRNRWEWNKTSFDEIIHFGKWIFLSSLTGFLVSNADRFVLAGLLGAASFGVYVISFLMFSAADQILTKIVSDIAHPALSEIARERPEDMKEKYYRFYVVICSLAYFISGFLIMSGQTLVHTLYDQRYHDAGWMLEILAVAILTIPMRLTSQVFLIFGNSKLFSHLYLIRLISLYGGMPLGFYFFGIPGGIASISLSYFSAIPVCIFYAMKYNLFSLRKEVLLLSIIFTGLIAGLGFNFVIEWARAMFV